MGGTPNTVQGIDDALTKFMATHKGMLASVLMDGNGSLTIAVYADAGQAQTWVSLESWATAIPDLLGAHLDVITKKIVETARGTDNR